MLGSILAVVVTFGLVVFIHELGHFLMAKRLGILVEDFSFGFGPAIFSRRRGETVYNLRCVPLGGYVKMAGEDMGEAKEGSREYFSKPWHARLRVVVAGPLMNYVLAFFIFSGVIYFVGEPTPTSEPVIGEVAESSPAQAAGLKEEDRIVSLDGKTISSWKQMALYIQGRPEKKIVLKYLRDAKEETAEITPRLEKSENIGLIGVAAKIEYAPVGFVNSVKMGAYQCYYWTSTTLVTLGSKIWHGEKPDFAGPVGIVHMVSSAARAGLANLIFLIGIISVAIGLFNLLPIPILDGGNAVLYLWEGASRRRLTEKAVSFVNSVGLAIILCIFLFATYSDIMRFRETKHQAAAEAQK